jgi:AcrR family transcriptional regulator
MPAESRPLRTNAMTTRLTLDHPTSEANAKRRQIIAGARAIFFAQGFDAASMGDIARAAGVSKGTLYILL